MQNHSRLKQKQNDERKSYTYPRQCNRNHKLMLVSHGSIGSWKNRIIWERKKSIIFTIWCYQIANARHTSFVEFNNRNKSTTEWEKCVNLHFARQMFVVKQCDRIHFNNQLIKWEKDEENKVADYEYENFECKMCVNCVCVHSNEKQLSET